MFGVFPNPVEDHRKKNEAIPRVNVINLGWLYRKKEKVFI